MNYFKAAETKFPLIGKVSKNKNVIQLKVYAICLMMPK